MQLGGNSKKLAPRNDNLMRQTKFPKKASSTDSIQELKEIFKDFKQREARLMQELDRGWEDLPSKNNERRELYSTKSQLRKKSAISVIKTPKQSQANPISFKKQPENPLKPPPVTCRNWVCLDGDSLDVIYGLRANEEREMASVTKVMTCLLTIEFINQYRVDLEKTCYLVSKRASKLGGTTANLRLDDYVCVKDLLFGLMLPSGNDAAQTLAENVVTHKLILDKHDGCDPNTLNYDEEVPREVNLEEEFYKMMNQKARKLGLFHTNYDSSHGLSNELNYSSCIDQAKLAVLAMKDPLFREIVSTPVYTGIIERNGREIELVWRNTNRLLDRRGYLGIKTGITNTAGGCLCSAYQNKGINVVTVVFGSRDHNTRFSDTEAIHNWVALNHKNITQLPPEERLLDSAPAL